MDAPAVSAPEPCLRVIVSQALADGCRCTSTSAQADADTETPRLDTLPPAWTGLQNDSALLPSLGALADSLASRGALQDLVSDPNSLFMLTVSSPPATQSGAPPADTRLSDGAVSSAAAAPSSAATDSIAEGQSAPQLNTSLNKHPSLRRDSPFMTYEPAYERTPAQTFMFALPPILEDNLDAARSAAATAEPMRNLVDAPSFRGYRSRSGLRSGAGIASKASSSQVDVSIALDGEEETAPLITASQRSAR